MPIDLENPSIAPPAAADLQSPATASPAPTAIAPPAAQQNTSAQNVSNRLNTFATDTMNAPGRFDIPMVQQGIDLIDFELSRQGDIGRRDLDEFMASRGTVGSSIEGEHRADLAANLEQQRSQRLFDLSSLMAQTSAQDRSAAANIGTQAVGTSLAVGGQGFEQQLASGQFQVQQEQFAADFAQRSGQWADSLGMDQAQLDEQIASRTAEYGDRQLERLSRMNLQEGAQGFAEQQNTLDRILQRESIALQKDGLDAETAWRDADRNLEEQLDQRALDLQEQGMAADEAYRNAALNMDREMRDADRAQDRDIASEGFSTDLFDSLTRYAAQKGDPIPTNIDQYIQMLQDYRASQNA